MKMRYPGNLTFHLIFTENRQAEKGSKQREACSALEEIEELWIWGKREGVERVEAGEAAVGIYCTREE